MRTSLLFFALTFCFLTAPHLTAQVSDPGVDQDAQAAREKLLKASDQLDNIQANSEATKVSVDAMKTGIATLQANVTQLQTENAALKQQLADQQTAFDQYKAQQTQARQALIDNVAAMIAAGKNSTSKSSEKKKKPLEVPTETSAPAPPPIPSNLLPPPDSSSPSTASSTSTTSTTSSATVDAPPPAPKPQKGYYHVVASGETLTMICAAYRDNGVHVTAAQIRKANGLTEDTALKTGQKLFIPKPGN